MTFAAGLKLLLLVSIFGTVFALALRASIADAFYFIRHWRAGLRAFAAIYIVVPIVAIALAMAIDPLPPVKLALVALAFSPVPPILPRRQLKSGSGGSYVIGLLIAAALTSLIVTPVGIAIASRLFAVSAHVSPGAIVPPVLVTIGAPLAAGLFCQRLLGRSAVRWALIIGKASMMSLIIGVAMLLFHFAPAMWSLIGNGTLLVLIAMIVAGLAAGYTLAGPARQEKSALALAASARHPGVAVAIASAAFPEERQAAAAILLFAVLSAIVSLLFVRRFAGGKTPKASATDAPPS